MSKKDSFKTSRHADDEMRNEESNFQVSNIQEHRIKGLKVKGLKVLIIGVGNRMRGDDAVGPLAIDRLQESATVPQHWVLVDTGEVPENALGLIEKEKPSRILLIDACDWGAEPGEVRFFSADELEKLPIRMVSTHGLPLSFWVKMTKLDHPDVMIELLGVQAAELTFNAALTPPVAAALEKIEGTIGYHFGVVSFNS